MTYSPSHASAWGKILVRDLDAASALAFAQETPTGAASRRKLGMCFWGHP